MILKIHHLFLYEKQNPVGICHAFYSDDQVWVEGIRIEPEFRRQKIASELVKHAENVGKEKGISHSFMLIDTENSSSLSMADSLGYDIFQTWNFYSLAPKKNNNFDVEFGNSLNIELYQNYVNSWRWFSLNDEVISKLSEQKRIIKSQHDKESLAILTDSQHFDNTLIVTLFSNSEESTKEILSYLQNYGAEKNTRIQILTKETLPAFESIELRISFHLMHKNLI